jgi:hypothetical protein
MIESLNNDDFEFIDVGELTPIQDQKINYQEQEYSYINLCLLPSTKSEFLQLIDDLKGQDDNILITIEDYKDLKELLTFAFRNGFKTNGSAMRKFIDIVNQHRESLNKCNI